MSTYYNQHLDIIKLMRWLILLSLFFAGISQASTPVSRLSVKFHGKSYSEEVWLYIVSPVTKLYVFYEKDVSHVLLEPTAADPRSIYPKLTMTYYKYPEIAGDPLTTLQQLTVSTNPMKFQRWTHLAVALTHEDEVTCRLFLNGVASPHCNNVVASSEVFKVTASLLRRNLPMTSICCCLTRMTREAIGGITSISGTTSCGTTV